MQGSRSHQDGQGYANSFAFYSNVHSLDCRTRKLFARTRIGSDSGPIFQHTPPQASTRTIGRAYREALKNKLRLVVPLSRIDELIESSGSSFEQFIANAAHAVIRLTLLWDYIHTHNTHRRTNMLVCYSASLCTHSLSKTF